MNLKRLNEMIKKTKAHESHASTNNSPLNLIILKSVHLRNLISLGQSFFQTSS